MAAGGSSSS